MNDYPRQQPMQISAEDLKAEELRLRYIDMLQSRNVFPTKANWQYICDHQMHGLGELLIAKYLTAIDIEEYDRAELHETAIEQFPIYLQSIDRDEAVRTVYDNINANRGAILNLIRNCQLFDAKRLTALLSIGDIDAVTAILDVYQPSYSASDLQSMTLLSRRLHSLPNRGSIEERHGVFGSSRKYICPQGHANNEETIYCTSCGQNQVGLTQSQVAQIELFDNRITALTNLIAK